MARSFNGTSDFIAIGAGFTLPATTSLFAWIRPTLATQGEIVGATASGGLEWIANTNGTTQLVQSLVAGLQISQNFPLTANVWNSVSTDFTPNTAHFYHNNQNALSATQSNWSGTPTNAFIGKRSGGTPLFFPGRIAELAIWNVVISAGEHTALHTGARAYKIRPSALIGYWPLFGLASPEPDFSGFAHNGTLTGTALAGGPPTTMFTPRWSQVLVPPPPTFVLMPQICM